MVFLHFNCYSLHVDLIILFFLLLGHLKSLPCFVTDKEPSLQHFTLVISLVKFVRAHLALSFVFKSITQSLAFLLAFSPCLVNFSCNPLSACLCRQTAV